MQGLDRVAPARGGQRQHPFVGGIELGDPGGELGHAGRAGMRTLPAGQLLAVETVIGGAVAVDPLDTVEGLDVETVARRLM